MSGDDILVVEDNQLNLELVHYLLEEAGFAVRVACDAEAARRELGRQPPALVLMDMQLPRTDGLTLVAEIRRTPELSTLPVIALTAHAMRGDRERFLAGGCDGYIAKPINADTFVHEVRELLGSLGQRREDPDA